MIQVVFTVDSGVITGFSLSGHADYSENGSDIVCAAVSSAAYMTANTITEIMELDCSVTADDGFMGLSLPYNEAEQAQVILNGLLLHLNALCEEYAKFIDLKISEV